MKEFQDIHYHVILVESMTRSRNAEQAVKELVDDLVETAHIQGRRANEVPLFTIVDYYSNYYELRCEDATEEEARAVPKMVFEEKIEEYYDCASGLSILIAFMEQMENRVGRKGRVSFHVINNGYNSLGVINLRVGSVRMAFRLLPDRQSRGHGDGTFLVALHASGRSMGHGKPFYERHVVTNHRHAFGRRQVRTGAVDAAGAQERPAETVYPAGCGL